MKAKVYMITAMLIFGSIGLFVRNIDMLSSQIALARGCIGSVFLLATAYITGNKLSWKDIKPNFILLLAAGAALGINWIFLFEAYTFTSISNATLCYYTSPVIITFLSLFILKERLYKFNVLCIILSMVGMMLVVGVDVSLFDKGNLIGIGYGLLAALFYATVVLINKVIKGISSLETTIIQLTISAIVLLPYVLIKEPINTKSIDYTSWILIGIIGLVHTGIAYFLYFKAIRELEGNSIAVFSYIDPISAILLSVIILGEPMNIPQIIGGVIILGAACLNELYLGRKRV